MVSLWDKVDLKFLFIETRKMALSKHQRAFVYMTLGAMTELGFTAIRRWPQLEGRTQLWVLPLYYFGSIYMFEPIYRRWRHHYLLMRLLMYAVSILGIEYVAGWILHRVIGVCPWEYKNRRWGVHGYIDLAYAPLWASICFAGEFVSSRMDQVHLGRADKAVVPFNRSIQQIMNSMHR
jgi:uncharacterized membrane protein